MERIVHGFCVYYCCSKIVKISMGSSVIDISFNTGNLILRNMTHKDITQNYVDWLNDPEINKYLGCADSQQTIDTCKKYIESFESRKDIALVGIFLNGTGLHIGNVTLAPPIDWVRGLGNIGISIGRKSCAGKGFAREALSAITVHCFERLQMKKMHACIDTSNIRCVNLFLSCGYRIEGLINYSELKYGQLKREYAYSAYFESEFRKRPSLFAGEGRGWYFLVLSHNYRLGQEVKNNGEPTD